MDTIEARTRMLELAERAAKVIRDFQAGEYAPVAAQQSVRGLIQEARPLIGDAGYPGEGVWTSLRHVEVGFTAYEEAPESPYLADVLEELRTAAHTLDVLLGLRISRDVDFRIVG